MKRRKAIYSGIFLDADAETAVLNYWGEEVLTRVLTHHITLKFRPTERDILSIPIGTRVFFQIISRGSDTKAQALGVKLSDKIQTLCNNETPHLTVAVAEGVSPVHSNELSFIPEDGPIISGRIGIFTGSKVQYDLKETIYQKE